MTGAERCASVTAMRHRTLILLGSLAIAAAFAALVRARGSWHGSRPDPSRFPVWGIDVSHHQGDIDWTAVAAERPVAFVYIKASEGGDWTDPRFADNWRHARRAGLRAGAYHFFTFCRPAIEQARHFLSLAPREPDALPPALDVEIEGNCAKAPDRAALRRELFAWLSAVEHAIGRRPILYATSEGYASFLSDWEHTYPIWIRDIDSEPALPDGRSWTIWQLDSEARVRGIDAAVDLNVIRGGLDVLERR